MSVNGQLSVPRLLVDTLLILKGNCLQGRSYYTWRCGYYLRTKYECILRDLFFYTYTYS